MCFSHTSSLLFPPPPDDDAVVVVVVAVAAVVVDADVVVDDVVVVVPTAAAALPLSPPVPLSPVLVVPIVCWTRWWMYAWYTFRQRAMLSSQS